ncbi:MAG: hypothetical protein ACLSGS_10480 [Adlercreutzia sp.]
MTVDIEGGALTLGVDDAELNAVARPGAAGAEARPRVLAKREARLVGRQGAYVS